MICRRNFHILPAVRLYLSRVVLTVEVPGKAVASL